MSGLFGFYLTCRCLREHFQFSHRQDGCRSKLATAAPVFCAVLLLGMASARANAKPISNFVVTTAADDSGTAANCTAQAAAGTGTDVSCSLRDALLAASAAGGANISFDKTVFAAATVISLTNGALTIPAFTTITGTGTTMLAIDGNKSSSIFEVASGVTASVTNLTMQDAQGTSQLGGALYNAGNLTLTGVLVQTSHPSGYSGGAGIYNDATGTLTVSNSTIYDNGSSYFGGNSGNGGGILNEGGNVTVVGSVVADNDASLSGGNILSSGGSVTIANSTITGSSGTLVGGGLSVGNGTVSVIDSTIAFNYAGSDPGVYAVGGTVSVTNSIVAANGSSAASTGNCSGCTLTGSNVIDTDPMLSVLGSYGGPTLTMVPLPGSSAICGGAATAYTTDQRGFARPTGSCYDVGAVQTDYAVAFQQQPTNVNVNAIMAPPVTVTVLDHGIGIPGASVNLTLNGAGTLRGALSPLTDISGVAAFPNLSVSAAGTGDTLTATAGNTLTTTSNTFDVTQIAGMLSFAPAPATQVYGTAIASGSLDATATYSGSPVAGTYAYTTQVNGSPQTLMAGATVLPAGAYIITAMFTPTNSAVYATASTTAAYTVTQASTTTTLSASSTTINAGQNETLTASVTSVAAGMPAGTVSIYDGATLLGTTTLNSGTATYSTAALAPGVTHRLTAKYSGDVDFAASSTTSPVSVTVISADFTMTVIGPGTATVIPGASTAYQVMLTPDAATFSSTVNFAVTGLPSGATATFSPPDIPPGGGSQTVTMTITSAPAAAAAHEPSQPASSHQAAPLALAMLGLLGLGGLWKRGKEFRRLLCILALLTAGTAAMFTISGCGSNNGFFAHAQKNYPLTVTATSGGTQHSADVILNVQ
jgi:hypothetical protein